MSEKERKIPQDSDKKVNKVDQVIEPSPGALPGLTPSTTPDAADPILELTFYHGLIPREDMKEILKENGDFLLRNTELVSGDARTYCLSVRWGEEVRHFALQKRANQQYCIDGKQFFPTIISMIEHYTRSGETFTQYNLALYRPIPREKWELLHNQVQLNEKLGTGAFGDVHRGTITVDNETITVAIKTLKCMTQTKEKIEEIMSEARIMRKLDHKNIVKCYGVSADVEPLYIIMEFVKGGGLDSFLKKNGYKLELSHRMKMMLDIASAIEYIHSKKIIHRDIAARNCLYGDEIVKISDFGMSRFAKQLKLGNNDRSAIRWCAPEVFTKRTVSRASDVWAMGVLFWEVFANGKQPYIGWSLQLVRDQVAVHRQHLSMGEEVLKEIRELVTLMFTYEEEKRITAQEVLERVEDIYKKRVEEDERLVSHLRRASSARKKAFKKEGGKGSSSVEDKRSLDIPMSMRKKNPSKKSAIDVAREDKVANLSKRKRKSKARRKSGNRKNWESDSSKDVDEDKFHKVKKSTIDESKRKLKKNRH